jgi:hypothetical protein
VERVRWLILALAATCLAFVVVGTMLGFAPAGRTFADWLTYVHAVERLQAGQPIYAPEQLAGPYVLVGVTLFGYAYPPASVPLFLPFTSFPLGLVSWLTLNAGLFLTGIYAILRVELRRPAPLEFAFVLAALAVVRGFPEGVAFGNASVGVAGLFAWSWVIGRGRVATGVLAGIGATIKLVPGALTFWSERADFPRVLAVTAATLAALAFLTLPAVGVQAWADYVRALSLSVPACGSEPPVSLACLIEPWLGVSLAKSAGIVVAIAAGLAAVVVRPKLLAFGLVAIAWLAPVTDLHYHYLLVGYAWLVAAFTRVLTARARSVPVVDDPAPA